MPTGLCGSEASQYLQPLDRYQPEIARSTRWAGKIAVHGNSLRTASYCSIPWLQGLLSKFSDLRRMETILAIALRCGNDAICPAAIPFLRQPDPPGNWPASFLPAC